MKQGQRAHGYTVVEVMIFLVVTSALFVIAVVYISGQQRKTEFSQAIRNIQSKINDTINNVSTGYYYNSGSFNCTSNGSGPTLGPGSQGQGEHKDCIFLGRAMQFAANGASSNFNIYNLVGQRTISGGQQAQNLADALPKAISPPNGADTTETGRLQYGLTAVKMFYTISGADQPIGTVAFVPTLAAYSGGNLASGAQNIELRPVSSTTLGEPADVAVGKISVANMPDAIKNPSGGVTICFKSGGTDQYGVITIGNSQNQLSTNLDILTTAQATDPVTGVCR